MQDISNPQRRAPVESGESISINVNNKSRNGGKNPRGSKSKSRLIIGISVAAIMIIGALVAFLIFQRAEINRLNDPAASAEQTKKDAEDLKNKVSKLMQIPDETPTVATVQDMEKLKEQEFFKDAKNGDKVLIFTNAKKAVIYRESENRIINSGPIVLNSTNTDAAATPESESEQE